MNGRERRDETPARIAFRIPFEVRSYELDSLGHVNNAVYFSWLEEGTFRFLADHDLPFHRFEDLRWYPIIAHAEVDYLREIRHGDRVALEGWPEKYGRTSLTIGYRFMRSEANGETDEIVALGRRVWVFVHDELGKIPVPDTIRDAFGPVAD